MVWIIGLFITVLVLASAVPVLYWKYRPLSDIDVAPSLKLETWAAVPPDAHHSNTDLIKYQGQYLLVHATSRWHFAYKKCKLAVRSSQDGKSWKVLSEIRVPGEDVRDPKFAIIGDKLFLYFLTQLPFTQIGAAEPHIISLILHPIKIVDAVQERQGNIAHMDVITHKMRLIENDKPIIKRPVREIIYQKVDPHAGADAKDRG